MAVRILHFHCHKSGSLPGQGTQVPQAIQSDTPPNNYPITKWASDQNRHLTNEDIQMATKM